MAGLKKRGEDANPYGSRYKAEVGGWDAGKGTRTYTRPTYTLFVVGIPDAESSDSVQRVFERDPGFLQARPVGYKTSRRMVFVDYDSPEHAHKAMIAHQGHKWHEVDVGLKIDFDHDARTKRNVALDQGHFEKFWPCGPRRARPESERDIYARLKSEAAEKQVTQNQPVAMMQTRSRPKRAGLAAKLRIKDHDNPTKPGDGKSCVETDAAPCNKADEQAAALGGLLGYGSASEGETEEEEAEESNESEEEEDDEEDDEIDEYIPVNKKARPS